MNEKQVLSNLAKDLSLSIVDLVSEYHLFLEHEKLKSDETSAKKFESVVREAYAKKSEQSSTETEEKFESISEDEQAMQSFFKENDGKSRYIDFPQYVTKILRNITVTSEIDKFKQPVFDYEILTEKGWFKQHFAFPQSLRTRIANLVKDNQLKKYVSVMYKGMEQAKDSVFEHKAFFTLTADNFAELKKLIENPPKKEK